MARMHERPNRIEQVAVNDLIPYDKNPRKHGKNVDEIVKMIKEVGFTNPIIIDQSNRIVAGHGRRLASIKLNLMRVPCIRVELTDSEYHKVLIADNKISELSKWDNKLLKDCMSILDDLGEIKVPGFEDGEIDKLFGHEPVVKTSTKEAAKEIAKDNDLELDGNAPVEVERIPAPGEDDPNKPAPRLKEMRIKFTSKQYKTVASKLRAIVKEHDLDSEAEAILKALESFKKETTTIRRKK